MEKQSRSPIFLDAQKTALVCIDLQEGILALSYQPYSSEQILENCISLIQRFHDAHAPVIFVHVGWRSDFSDAPHGLVDSPRSYPKEGLPKEWSRLSSALPKKDDDILIKKHQWNAFFGTDLDLQLRRRGLTTIVLVGLTANLGVESTAREAYERNYHVVLIKEATSGFNLEAYTFAIEQIFPRISRVCSSSELTISKAN